MLNKLVALLLCFLLVMPTLALADPPEAPDTPPQPKITSVAKGETVPYSGVLLNTTAAAKIFTERDFFNEECALKISYAVEKERLRLQLLLDSTQTSMDAMDKKYKSLLTIKDEELKRLSKIATETNDYSSWWFRGSSLP